MSNVVCHWWFQRLSAVIMLLLFPWFVYTFIHLFIIQNEQQVINFVLAHPLQLFTFFVLLFFIFWHAVLGMQVICEDYIYDAKVRLLVYVFIKAISVTTFCGVLIALFYFLYINQS